MAKFNEQFGIRRWTYASIHTTFVIAICDGFFYSTCIQVNMYTFILYINTWTPIYMYHLHLSLYTFNLIYITLHLIKHQYSLWSSILSSYKVENVLHNLVTRLLPSCWLYTTLSQACYRRKTSRVYECTWHSRHQLTIMKVSCHHESIHHKLAKCEVTLTPNLYVLTRVYM